MEDADWMVKAPRAGVIGAPEFFHEYIGHRLARRFRIGVAAVGVIEVDDDFLADMKDTAMEKYNFEAGKCVGCRFLKGLETLGPRSFIRPEWMAEAYRLYAFDLWMGNDDRTIINSNCGFHQKKLLAYDFERIMPDREQPAWQVSDQERVPRHILHRSLHGQPGLWDEFIECLDDLNEEWVRGQVADLPPSWANSWRVDRLIAHIKSAQSNKAKLRQQLDICLLKPLPAPPANNPSVGGETT